MRGKSLGIRRLFGGSARDGEGEDTFAFLDGPGVHGSAGDGEAHAPPRVAEASGVAVPGGEPGEEDGDAASYVRDRVTTILLEKEVVTPKQVREAEQQWQREGQRDTLWRVLARHPKVDRNMVYAEAARVYAFRRAVIEDGKPDLGFVTRVIESFSEAHRERLVALGLLPLEYQIDASRGVLTLVLAANDPARPETLRLIHDLNLDNFELCYAPESEIVPLLEALFPKRNEYLERLAEDENAQAFDLGASFQGKDTDLVDQEALDAEINRSSLINLFEGALVDAVRRGASDIHIFPNSNKQTEYHFRIDGELQLWQAETKVNPESMLAVVKDRCLNIDRFEREAAQDGYIQRTVDGALIRYRVSILPIASAVREVKAESIVIRVLDDRKVFNDLGQLGLLPGALERFQKAIHQPQGMIIMTGPTGSGKSTTLVAALHQIVRPQVNVLTVEDPVEYIIRGVRQIKLGSRLRLEDALRSILRHDPDVVMVGEMRDRATAELAVKLANTGHLTFTTLHTNDAPSAISRLYKMGIEPFLIAYAINLIVAQRLIRTLCPRCKQVDPDPDVVLLRELGFSEADLAGTTFYRPGSQEGCRMCRGVGYKGRRAISEALYFSRAIRHLVVNARENIDEDAIRETAVREGMLTLLASAREVVRQGETSVQEVLRVIASD